MKQTLALILALLLVGSYAFRLEAMHSDHDNQAHAIAGKCPEGCTKGKENICEDDNLL